MDTAILPLPIPSKPGVVPSGANRSSADPVNAAAAADSAAWIHASFFRSAIALMFTLGGAWGAYLLLKIAFHQSSVAIGIREVNAHGHAQIFGWVGLFVMGVSYALFPRLRGIALPRPALARATLVLMLVGIALRSFGEALIETRAAFFWPALAGAIVEIVAIVLFVIGIVGVLRAPGRPFPANSAFVYSALGWFLVQAVYETLFFVGTGRAETLEALLPLVAGWQAGLRDVQIHGFAMLMVLGVSHYLFHTLYGFPSPSRRRSLVCAIALNLAIAGEATGLHLMHAAGHRWAALWMVSVLVILVALASLYWSWHLFSSRRVGNESPLQTTDGMNDSATGPRHRSDRSLKFFRAAAVWLFLSFAMLLLLPVWQFAVLPWLAPDSHAVAMGFSHAYYGAIRHAITVGFISLMILGVSARLVPMWAGLNPRRLSGLWIPFVLLNVGCAMRVGLQTLTDVTPAVYPLAGASGLVEMLAIAIWAIHLWRLLGRRPADGRVDSRELGTAAA